MVIHPYAACDALYKAGFRYGKGLVIGLAVVWAESRFTATARHVNDDGSIDRGLWQINDRAHPGVSDDAAYDPVAASRVAWTLSAGGTNFTPWAAYGHGEVGKPFREWMEQARYLTALYYAVELGMHDMARRIIDAP